MFGLQFKYFPKRLQNVVAPTDSRRRLDMRLVDEGKYNLLILRKTNWKMLRGCAKNSETRVENSGYQSTSLKAETLKE